MLLDHNANINAQDRDRDTPLLSTIFFDWISWSIDIAKILMSTGANVEIKNKFGETAWQIAEDKPKML